VFELFGQYFLRKSDSLKRAQKNFAARVPLIQGSNLGKRIMPKLELVGRLQIDLLRLVLRNIYLVTLPSNGSIQDNFRKKKFTKTSGCFFFLQNAFASKTTIWYASALGMHPTCQSIDPLAAYN